MCSLGEPGLGADDELQQFLLGVTTGALETATNGVERGSPPPGGVWGGSAPHSMGLAYRQATRPCYLGVHTMPDLVLLIRSTPMVLHNGRVHVEVSWMQGVIT